MPRLPSLKSNLNLRTTTGTNHNIGSSTMVSDDVEARVLGIPGVEGPVGPAGEDKNYVHTQGLASTVWIINHNLNKLPSVTILDSALNEVIGDVIYIDNNNLHVIFSSIFSGIATLN